MSLGYIFRQRRMELELSQPELAERAGIEQSYLSKLENDHSLPSDDILLRLLSALNLSVEQLCRQLDIAKTNPKILSIPSIEQHLHHQQKRSRRSTLTAFIVSSLLIAFAVPLFYAGYTGLFFSSTQYTYVSRGEIPADEPLDYFRNGWARGLQSNFSFGSSEGIRERETLQANAENTMLSQIDYLYIKTFTKLPAPFLEEQPSGLTRVFHPDDTSSVSRPVNGWMQACGLFLFVLGVMILISQSLIRRT